MLIEMAERTIDRVKLEIGLQTALLGGASVKTNGKPHIRRLFDHIRRGERTVFSEYIHINDGYDYTSQIKGLENLDALRNEPIIAIFNHSNAGTLRGKGQLLVISHYTKQKTGQEIKYLHGRDNSTPQEWMRKQGDYVLDMVPVREDNPKDIAETAVLIQEAFSKKQSMGISPEGDGSTNVIRAIPNKSLILAVPRSGDFILMSAIEGYNLVCFATRFEDDTFFLTIDEPLDNEKVRKAKRVFAVDPQNPNNKKFYSQNIADYAMARIARLLPEDKRGHYSNYQEIIAEFESRCS